MSLKAKGIISIIGKRSELACVRDKITEEAVNNNINTDIIDDIIISVDEACSNIIDHNYRGKLRDKIIVEYYIYKDKVKIVISDNGFEFNPINHKLPDVDRHLKVLKSRGLGIFIIKKLVDSIEHKYYPGQGNKLILIKKI